MSGCKISGKEFETYLRINKLIEIKSYKEDDLIRATGTPIIIHSDNI